MKPYKKIEVTKIMACQYGKDSEAEKFLTKCTKNEKGEIKSTNNGMLGIPKDPFMAVNTFDGYRRIEKGDWIVQDGEKIFIVPEGVFQLMFAQE
jgi:hypothetical protein